MTHVFTDSEYNEYLRIKEEYTHLKREREIIIERAMEIINGDKYVHCYYSERGGYYCDDCVPGLILPECPFLHLRDYSK